MFKPDKPIASSKEDKLDRSAFAKSLGEAILKHHEKDSIVVGLYGTWGSGKTSILNMTLEYIELASKNISRNKKPIITKFNPWNYSDQNQLILQYFKHLSVVLQKPNYSKNLQQAGKQLELYANFFSPLKYIPAISQFAVVAEEILKSIGSSAQNLATGIENNLDVSRLELNKLLSKQLQKIIVVIDDIDRLNSMEIRQIFQLIKALGDFPNTIYLLAFDKNVVAKALKPEQEGTGLEYLEKMVQMPIEIPLISKVEVEKMLFGQLDEIIKEIPESKWDKSYWANVYMSGLKYFFNNIRDISRFINSLRFSFNMVREEVNPIDFIAITAIQVFMPDLYYSIRDNKEMFAGVYSETDRRHEVQEKEKEHYNKLIDQSHILPREILIEFLKIIFPKLEDVYGHSYYGSSWMNNWRKKRRLCSPDVFDIYFKLSISKEELSQNEIATILLHGNSQKVFSEDLLRLNEKGKISRFLDLLEDYTKEDISEENIEPIIAVLMDVGDLFLEGDTGFFGFDTPMRIMRVIYQLIHRFSDYDKRFTVLKNAINNSQRSIYIAIQEVAIQNQEHGKYGTEEISEPEEKLTLRLEQVTELESLVCKKIGIWANDGRLKKHKDLISILYSWKQWGDSEKVNSFIKDLIKDDEGLINFITAFLNKIESQELSSYSYEIKWRIKINSVKEFVNVNDIEPRLRNIYHSQDYEKLDDRKKLGIKTFIDTIDGKIKDPFPR